MEKLIGKVMAAIIMFFVLIGVGGPMLYSGSYYIINHVDTSIYDRYATDGKYSDNIFFSEKIEEETNIFSEIVNKLGISIESIERKQDIAKIIYENREEVSEVISSNNKYCNYLKEKGATIDEFFLWNKKIAEIDEIFFETIIFILCLVYAFIWILIFKWRTAFYIGSGIIYIICTLSYFSGGITDYLLVNLANCFPKEVFSSITYLDMEEMRNLFISGFKESMLAFIIFDTLFQAAESNRTLRAEKEIKNIIYSLDYLILQLSRYANSTCIYKIKAKYTVASLINICNKKDNDANYRNLKIQLEDREFWDEGHTTIEYLQKFKIIRQYIFRCRLS